MIYRVADNRSVSHSGKTYSGGDDLPEMTDAQAAALIACGAAVAVESQPEAEPDASVEVESKPSKPKRQPRAKP